MKTFFDDIFTYHHHTNQKIAELIWQNTDKVNDEGKLLFSHMLNAHQIWNARILNKPSVGVWQMQPPEVFKKMDDANYNTTREIVTECPIDLTIQYQNTKGEAFVKTIQTILYHIANHTSHHRGQLMTMLKHADVPIFPTDYIYYKML